ncbi:MAG: sel1 repeat family protein [Deltaproteobacteria bacterium]|jgi:TPR repeat protein|nr:sel1 repeat family protein [Deltaproteobacteria bacterium]
MSDKAKGIVFSLAFLFVCLFSMAAVAEIDKAMMDAAQGGDAQAQFDVALAYDEGEGVPVDDVKAIFWYTKAAENGNDQAAYNLGIMYDTGEGMPAPDQKKSFELYTQCAESGFDNCQYNLGVAYYNGEGVEADEAKGIAWITKAAAAGHEQARSVLADIQ